MPRTYSSIDKIRAELAWGTDPNKCGCRNLRCCEETLAVQHVGLAARDILGVSRIHQHDLDPLSILKSDRPESSTLRSIPWQPCRCRNGSTNRQARADRP